MTPCPLHVHLLPFTAQKGQLLRVDREDREYFLSWKKKYIDRITNMNNKNKIGYKIVEGRYKDDFEKDCERLLERGWKPYGEMRFSPAISVRFSQTFIRGVDLSK